jgi:membrane protein implicated in regulation of membrane protease activity
LLGGPAWLQVLFFILGALASLAVLRPIARAHLKMPAITRTGTAALVGTRALVLERVDLNGGRVRIGGEEWSARAYMEDQVLEPGTRVEVAKIEGATALVYE